MISNKGEASFAKYLTRQRVPWIHHPERINRYQPDFFVPSTKTYYEVIGTRQALHQNHRRITCIILSQPSVKLILVRPSGQIIPYRIERNEVLFKTPTGRWSRFGKNRIGLGSRYDYTQIGKLQEFLGWSNQDVSDKLKTMGVDVSDQTISNWRNGTTNPGADKLAILAAAFGVAIERFYPEK